jgi:hypothetical protein
MLATILLMFSLGHSFLAIFGERQLAAKNLHAAEKLFERQNQVVRLNSARNGLSIVPTVPRCAAKSFPPSLGTTA